MSCALNEGDVKSTSFHSLSSLSERVECFEHDRSGSDG